MSSTRSPDTSPASHGGKKVLIVAGEASGDLHGSSLVREMRTLRPSLRFYGIGGERMKKAGVDLVAASADMAVVGLTEVVGKLPFILGILKRLKASLVTEKPDLVILIDYPDFNLPLARWACRKGIPVFYYISPQVWAWRRRRVKKIKKYVRRMAVILPFEKALYEEAGMPDVHFAGHPLLDVVKSSFSPEEIRRRLEVKEKQHLVALLPGSRTGEVKTLLPVMIETARRLKAHLPDLVFAVPLAETVPERVVSDIIGKPEIPVRVIPNHVYDLLAVADGALVASGTATLETALMGTPMAVLYRVSPISYFIGRLVIRIRSIALVNIVAGRTIVPEFIQKQAEPEAMSRALLKILTDSTVRKRMSDDLRTLREKLGEPGAGKRVAQLALDLL
ncbi:MAG TPA: lipid-A-disaccharide synthase [Syntrophales bacterium]|nr:lipid-A-disaccharide synthase [Syntrophales bacterium]